MNLFFRSFFDTPEEIFITSHSSHAGQAVGVIVAESEVIARKAAKAVKITYKNLKEPILVKRRLFFIQISFSKFKYQELFGLSWVSCDNIS